MRVGTTDLRSCIIKIIVVVVVVEEVNKKVKNSLK